MSTSENAAVPSSYGGVRVARQPLSGSPATPGWRAPRFFKLLSFDPSRVTFVLASAITPATAMALAGISDDHATTVAVLVAAVTVVAGGIAWIDRRIDTRMKRHEEEEKERDAALARLNAERHEARARLEAERHERVMAEIGHVKESIALRNELRAMRSALGINRGDPE